MASKQKKDVTPEKETKKQTKKKSAAKPEAKKAEKENTGAKQPEQTKIRLAPDPDSVIHKIIPCLFVLCALITLVFLFAGNSSGFLGKAANVLFFSLFGYAAWLIPLILVLFALRWRKIVEEDCRLSAFIFCVLFLVAASALTHAIYTPKPVLDIDKLFTARVGGGAIGTLIAFLLIESVGAPTTFIITIILTLVCLMFFMSLTPKEIWIFVRYRIKLARERREARLEREALEQEKREAEEREREAERKEKEAKDAALDDGEQTETPVVSYIDDEDEDDEIFVPEEEVPAPTDADLPAETTADEPVKDEPVKTAVLLEPAKNDGEGKVILPDLEEIFGIADPNKVNELSGLEDPEELPADITEEKQNAILEDAPKPVEKPKPKPVPYKAPPISLLAVPEKPKGEDMTAEMQANAQRLVETLASFRVYTKITSVSVGPTITRYELQPEKGTSVRSIANRVDDIALSLASMGVRIEAPIPGKAAVGIEVPNKVAATVYLRELIASKQFTCEENKKRKLMAALGVDVGGSPVFCDISKMPHMLVAGATGMGKSVCINSLLVSLLYRTSPEDLRLILVDPKRVELGTYNGIPHLLVPVVTEPQKAAGALSWAVNEMERRFGLIEEVGARNIGDYNGTVDGVPGYEKMPYIVIIIDELADLMLVARDTVESSINRLAAKARAAGIHLVIGTQRPSVDVITGLIKANIPSRIAFTVASQVDSRTIIDVGGAERLNGRGDMLYAPVGMMKPMRVQGSFVSTEEVERVCSYVRSKAGLNEYSEEIMADIEREAQRCASPKSSMSDDGGDEGGELDPKFRQAVELAVNSNKIATSMLQRNLSVGYGRAAKIIDQMERLGYVGPPDGTKPREVLITVQQFRELVVNDRLGERVDGE
ncbi:MAG: DNA translocase FtsK [Clostridia bacterium]|nr:DNA translocase FtsK [Clostridia bacterium]